MLRIGEADDLLCDLLKGAAERRRLADTKISICVCTTCGLPLNSLVFSWVLQSNVFAV